MPAAADKTAEATSEAPASPVTLTARAAEKVQQIRAEEKIQDGYALRLKVLGGGCSGFAYDLYFDQPQDIDQTFESNGVKLLCD
jgi:iron-sulfur cluster insertion protein